MLEVSPSHTVSLLRAVVKVVVSVEALSVQLLEVHQLHSYRFALQLRVAVVVQYLLFLSPLSLLSCRLAKRRSSATILQQREPV